MCNLKKHKTQQRILNRQNKTQTTQQENTDRTIQENKL